MRGDRGLFVLHTGPSPKSFSGFWKLDIFAVGFGGSESSSLISVSRSEYVGVVSWSPITT